MLERFGTFAGRSAYERILFLFDLLPLLAVIKGRLQLMHGGLPTEITKDYRLAVADAAENHGHDRILEELLWNDPRSDIHSGLDWEKSRRGFGKHFGANITKRWLELTGTKVVVRGHEPCKGFRIEHDGMMMTLFSCKESYPKFEAGYLLITRDQLQSIHNASDLAHYVRILDK
jgi:protein phosphatase